MTGVRFRGGGGPGGGGGVRQVRELPTPEKGLGNIYYVKEAYRGPGPWLSTDFDLTLTPANVASSGDPVLGYSAREQRVDLSQRNQGGSISPTPEGLLALIIQTQGSGLPGIPLIKLGGTALGQAAGRGLTLTFGGNSYEFLQIPNSDTWGVSQANQQVPEADIWMAGTPVVVRISITGTERALNYRSFAAVGEKTKPPFGPYRASDFDVTVTPAGLPAGQGVVTQRTGYAARELQSTNAAFGVTGAGGAIAPSGSPFLGIFVGFNARGPLTVLPTDEAGDAFRALSTGADKILVTIGANSYTLAPSRNPGEPAFFWNSENPGSDQILGANAWVAGTPVTLRMTSEDGQSGFTQEGVRTIGQPGNPRNIVGGEQIERGFWHVDPDTMAWRRGFGGDAGGIPAAWLPEAGLSDADVRNHRWKGPLVGVAREDVGPDWRLRTRAGQEAIDATQASVTISSGGATLVIELTIAGAVGAAGNAWRLNLRDGTGTSAGRQSGTVELVVNIGSGATFANIRSVINQRAALDGLRYTATLTAGLGTTAFPAAPRGVQNFAGGLDAVPAAELGVEMDVGNKVIELEHLTGHTQQEIVEFLDGYEVDSDTTLYAILYGGSDSTASLAAAPQERPFGEIYAEGSLPHPTADELAALEQRLDNLTFGDIDGQIADGQVPDAFTRDSEITRTFLLGVLGLSAQELNDLFVGATVSGSGSSRVITVTQADGTTVTLAVPDTTGGGGSGSDDGVITGASFSADGSTITITRSVGANIVVNVPAALRQAAGATPTVRNLTANYTIVAADIGNTVRLTGSTARTFTLPNIAGTVVVGSILRVVNDASAALTLDGDGSDTVDGAATLVLRPGEAVILQAVTASVWNLLSDTTSGEPQSWADIPSGSPVPLGQVVIHNGAYFGCIQAHNRVSTGPDGDSVRWILLSNWRGVWTDTWYPQGSFVSHASFPYAATQNVSRGDVAPNAATNTKWLLLGSIPTSVVSYSVNTIIPAANRGWTYRATGSTTRLLSLPNASGTGEVPNGWDVVVSNGSSADQTVEPNGSDTIGGNAGLTVAAGRAVRLQKVATGAWILIADTKDETGTGGTSPSVVLSGVGKGHPLDGKRRCLRP